MWRLAAALVAAAASAPVPTYTLLDGCAAASSGSDSSSGSGSGSLAAAPVCNYEAPCFFLCEHMPPSHLAVDDPACETYIRHNPTGQVFCVSAPYIYNTARRAG